jgi:hypothetical protein
MKKLDADSATYSSRNEGLAVSECCNYHRYDIDGDSKFGRIC